VSAGWRYWPLGRHAFAGAARLCRRGGGIGLWGDTPSPGRKGVSGGFPHPGGAARTSIGSVGRPRGAIVGAGAPVGSCAARAAGTLVTVGAGDDTVDRARVFLLLRPPLLLVLLLAAGAQTGTLTRHTARLDTALVWGPWLLMLGLGAAFAVVALLGRGVRQPWPALLVEGTAAGVLALVPPVMWIAWFRVTWFSRIVGGDTGVAFVQALALVWLVAVVLAAGRQLRGKTAASSAGQEAAGRRG
jgi:hypothetical protein